MHKHILVPVDLANPDPSAKAFEAARAIARRDGARISVVSVVPTWPEDLMAKEPRDYQPDLDVFLETVSDGTDMTGEVKNGGSISGRIIEAVANKKIDLVVMASHDPKMTDYLIGSNAAHVVLHAPCSVLVVRAKDGGGVAKNVLVPVDLARAESCLKAVGIARQIAEEAGGKLTVVNVQQVMSMDAPKSLDMFQPKLDAFVQEHAPGADAMLKIGLSVPSEIRWTADEIDADLIVMASHDPNFTDYLIGSNAAHVALHTPRSVMVVR